ncbi:hypothetical protein HPB48_000168 [Haemaphysalis longicornis]|uniref:Uncharacterized protein n=1 Tax=Haemaphysalis longicornis TaxID=44386 RepID=A0A9J6H0L7_HAELO|nr:hypothetical protein HPB48_000168 [Haemaphysalis longicornis]
MHHQTNQQSCLAQLQFLCLMHCRAPPSILTTIPLQLLEASVELAPLVFASATVVSNAQRISQMLLIRGSPQSLSPVARRKHSVWRRGRWHGVPSAVRAIDAVVDHRAVTPSPHPGLLLNASTFDFGIIPDPGFSFHLPTLERAPASSCPLQLIRESLFTDLSTMTSGIRGTKSSVTQQTLCPTPSPDLRNLSVATGAARTPTGREHWKYRSRLTRTSFVHICADSAFFCHLTCT